MRNNQTVFSRPLRALALIALCTASVSAFAQSQEYRRGYDDGFRAAQNGGQSGGYQSGDDRGRGQRISILEARYGRGGRVCDARRSVQNIVNQQGETTFEVNNDLCGDPAQNQTKTLYVTFQCGRSNPVRTSADETEGLRIACR